MRRISNAARRARVAHVRMAAGSFAWVLAMVFVIGISWTNYAQAGCVSGRCAYPTVTIASPPANASFRSTQSITLTGRATGDIVLDNVGNDRIFPISRVDIYRDGAVIGTATLGTLGYDSNGYPYRDYSYTYSPLAIGSHTLGAKAYDTGSSASGLTTRNIIVAANSSPTVALTAPAPDTVYTLPATVTLTANASDSDGTVSGVQYFVNTTAISGVLTAAPYTFAWTGLTVGDTYITAKVTDNDGATTTSTNNIHVIGNDRPTAVLNVSNANDLAPGTITLQATVTDSLGGTTIRYFQNGVDLSGVVGISPYTYNWTNIPAGTYSIVARATDGYGASSDSAPYSFIVNAAPSVSITAPASNTASTAPSNFNFTASASDSDGSIANVQYFSNGTAISGLLASSPYNFSWSGVASGTYTITARATDNRGTVTTSSPITVISNDRPAVSLNTSGATGLAPGSITLQGTVTNSLGSLSGVQYFANGNAISGTLTSAPYAFTWNSVAAGTYSIVARATDSYGASGDSAPYNFIVNAAPSVSITAPASNTVSTAPGTFTFTASAADTDGSITNVQYFSNGSAISGALTSTPYGFTWSGVASGTYSITARATDNRGTTTTSGAITVISNDGPAVTLSPSGVTGVAPGAVTLQSSVSNSLGSITGVQYFANGSAISGALTSAPYAFTWSSVGAGSYSIVARATDSYGATGDSSPYGFAVNGPPSIAVAAPSHGAVLLAPSAVTLGVSASDADGSIASVQYYLNGSALGSPVTSAPFSSTWNSPSAGTYSISARATDNGGASTLSGVVSVTINDRPSVTLTPSGVNGVAPGAVTLQSSVTNSVGSVTGVQYFANGSAISGSLTNAPYTFTWNDVAAGSYSIVARATDSYGATGDSSAYGWSVNQAPTVALTAPTNGTLMISTLPASVVLSANAADADGSIAKVEYVANGSVVATSTTAPFSTTWSAPTSGTHMMQARATDNVGYATTSATSLLTIDAPPTVSITSPSNGSSYAAGAQIPIAVNASDSDGSIAKVEIYHGATLITTLSGSPFSTSWTNGLTGAHTLTAKAYDNQGAVTTSAAISVTITSSAPPGSAVLVPNADAPDAGTLPGALTVGRDGTASYAIPIAVPPGTAGMVPSLSLRYSSGAKDGLMGRGWSIGGLSAIVRCPKTLEPDGKAGRVGLNTEDRYCLDGQKLILVSGTYGAAAEYRTEIDSFAKISSFGSDPAKGPDSWEVRSKGGRILHFGSTTDSTIEARGLSPTVVLSWQLSKIADRSGNYLTVSYDKSAMSFDGAFMPTQVSYTGNTNAPATAPYNAVRFVYETRPDPIVRYVGGTLTSILKRLAAVQTYVNIDAQGAAGQLVRDYRIAYTSSSQNGRSLVSNITLFDGASTPASIPGTQFTYQQRAGSDNSFAAADWGGPALSFYGDSPSLEGVLADSIIGDFNGDGRQDIAKGSGIDSSGNWNVCLSSGTGFTCQIWAGMAGTAKHVVPGDFDGDGRTDMLRMDGSLPFNQVRVCLSTGSSFNCQIWAGERRTRLVSGDFNGDGLDDVAISNGSTEQRLCVSTGTQFSCSDYANVNSAIDWNHPDELNTRAVRGDFNGDGRTDIAKYALDSAEELPSWWNVCLAGDTGFACSAWTGAIGTTQNALMPNYFGGSMTGDLNEDGLTDLVTSFTTGVKLCRSNGTTFVCADVPSAPQLYYYSSVADYDGDGRPDVFTTIDGVPYQGCQISNNDYACSAWGGTGYVPQPSTLGDVALGGYIGPFYGDFDGDGKSDLAFYSKTSNQWKVALSQGPEPDLLSAVTDGIGKRTEVTYDALTKASIYTKDSGTNVAVYPQRDVQSGSRVISQLRSDNGLGSFTNTDYRYGGKKQHLKGRGDLGFRWVTATDSVSHVTSYSEAGQQTFPFIGMTTVSRTTHDPSGCQLQQATSTLVNTTSYSGTVHFPRVSQVDEVHRELNGCAQVSTSTTDGVSYDTTYGNLLTSASTVVAGGETFSSALTNTYVPPDAAAWLVGLVDTTTITKVAPTPPGATANTVTRTTKYTYVGGTPLMATQTVEPNDVTLTLKTDTSSRDRFGNALTRKLVWTPPGAGATTTRTVETVVTMDPKGRWPLTTGNALGQQETRSFSDAHGSVISLVDANALTTTWQYDTFGSKTRQTDPDGTYTTFAFKQCTTDCGLARTVGISRDFSTTGTELSSPKLAYADVLGREVLTQSWGFDGTEVRAEKEYDSLRRLSRAARPHFAGETVAWTTYDQYDDLGRNTRFTTPDGLTTIAYAGLTTAYTNPKSQTRSELRNGLGLIKANTDPASKTATYWYDPFGNVLQAIDPLGNVIKASYDTLGRRKTLTDPDLGAWTYSLDALGQLVSQTDAKSQVTTFTYDDLGRMTRRLEPDLDSYWVFDSATKGVGQLAEAYTLTGTGTKDYRRVHGYDSLGRPATTTTTLDKDYVSLSAYESGTGRLLSQTHEVRTVGAGSGTGHTFTNVYNGLGYLERVTEEATVHWQALAQNALDQVTQSRQSNGIVTHRTYNPSTARLEGIAGLHPSTGLATIQSDTYAYDPLGNLLNRSQLVNSAGAKLQEVFEHDNRNRLTSSQVTYNGTAQAPKSFGYDDIGNLISKTGIGTYTYPASGTSSVRPHAVTSIAGTVNGVSNPSFNYDSNGNLVGGGGRTYVWTSYNRPQSISLGTGASTATDTFLHGTEHQRIKQTRSTGNPAVTASTVYYAGPIEREFTAAANTTVTKTYLPQGAGVVMDTQVGGNTPTTAVRGFHHDDLGSVNAITDESANVIERMSFDAWGLRRNLDGTDDAALPPGQIKGSVDNKGYTGHEQLDNVRLVHMNGRVYDPVVSRFTSADPFISDTEASQGTNRYTYVLNNPLSNTDPTGLQAETAADDKQPTQAEKKIAACAEQGGGSCAGAGEHGADIVVISLSAPSGTSASKSVVAQTAASMFDGVRLGTGSVSEPLSAAGVIREVGLRLVGDFVDNQKDQWGPMGLAAQWAERTFDRPTESWNGTAARGILTLAGMAPGGIVGKMKGSVSTIDPSLVRFTQSSVSSRFSTGQTLNETIAALRGPGGSALAARIPPIRLFEHERQLFTLDNRRLLTFSQAGRRIPFVMVDPTNPTIAREIMKKATTTPAQGMGQFVTVLP